MSKELVISSNRHETRVAILEEDQLVEIYFQRANEYSLAGSVHKGRVTRVLPGMQSAFVDLGLERDTFLYVSDFFEDHGEDYDKVTGGAEERPAPRTERSERPPAEAGGGDRPERNERRDRGERGGRNGHRGGRHERQDRNQSNQAPPAPHVQAAPAAEAVPDIEAPLLAELEPAVELGVLLEGETLATGAPAAGTAEAGAAGARPPRNDQDRRGGRRGRRRRGRGRGFPDSKYAPEGATEATAAAGEPVEEEEFDDAIVEPAAPEEVFVLPGESLAKYRHSAAPSHDLNEPAFELPLVEHFEPLQDPPVAHTEAVEVETPIEPESASATMLSAAEDPAEHPPANALPDAPVHPERIQDFVEIEEEEVLLEHGSIEGEPVALELEVELEEEPSDEPHPGLIEDEEDREIQEMIFEADEEADAAQEAAESGLEEIAASPVEGQQGQTEEGGTPLQAQVREGGRYMQRQGGRRMRRGRGDRGGDRRGGGGRDDRRPAGPGPEGQAAHAAAPAPVATPVAVPARGGQPISITDLLKEGQEIIVQIAKEPLGQKGARITSHIALPGRYVVYMPTLDHMGVSRKIASDEERHRLKRILQNARAGITGGCIIRTAGEGKSEEELTADIHFLYNLWLDIRQKAEKRPAPLLLHHDLDIVQRILRDQFNENFKAVWVDNEEMYESVMRFVQRFQPSLVSKVKLYTRPIPIFDAFNITMELEKALRPKIWLKSGGYIVINQTEALVAIDINTGKFVGKSNRLEDTIVKTNVEAVKEIVRQIRLRDLGGIIVIDFIDMDERKNRARVMQALEEAMRQDRAPYKILQFNDFGLVAITRKRVKQSLERALCAPCPYCEGAGSVKSVTTVLGEILQEAQKIASAVDGSNVMLRCNPEVAKILKSHHNQYLEELEEILKRPVLVKSDPSIHQEKFDLA